MIERVDYIRVPVTDIEAAKHFYGEILGLPRNTKLNHDDWIEYEAANVTLAVMTPETHEYEFAPLPPSTIALRVPDVAASMKRLRAAGVEFQFPEPYDSSVCHMAFFSDPDGNALMLHHRYAPYRDGSLP